MKPISLQTWSSSKWLAALMRHPSIRSFLILMNIILLFLLFPTVNILTMQKEGAFRDNQLERIIGQMHDSLESRSASLAGSIALSSAQAIAGYDFSTLNAMLEKVVANDPEIVYCIIMNQKRQAMVHTDPEKLGSVLTDESDYLAEEIMKKEYPSSILAEEFKKFIRFIHLDNAGNYPEPSGADIFNEEESHRGKAFMEVVAPIYSGSILWGALRLGYSDIQLYKEKQIVTQEWEKKMREFKIFFISITAIFSSIGVIVAVLFTRLLTKPMNVLSDGVNRISEGELSFKINQGRFVCREYLQLTSAFNSMTAKLRKSYEQLSEYSKSLEQKVDERTRELRETQATLIEKAHASGMAEIAVDVLHNIGNAITPAKIDAELVLGSMEKSVFRTRLKEMLRPIFEYLNNPTSSLSAEKNKILRILDLLPEGLTQEYKNFSSGLTSIIKKHQHIEEIIHLQMRYARLTENREYVKVNEVLEDALDMLKEAIQKRSVKVMKDFSDVPPVHIERAKLMQIFINLIKNGYEAMEPVSATERKFLITTSLEPGTPKSVRVAFMDSGIGFETEDKKKFFQYGYTTKSRGSGFGLHSCANFIKANNGSLTAFSEGKGNGAVFLINLIADDSDEGPIN